MAKEIKVVLARADSLEVGDVFESPHRAGVWRTVTTKPRVVGRNVVFEADGHVTIELAAALPVRVQIPA